MLLRMVVAGGGWWRTTRSGGRSSSKDGGRYFYIGVMMPLMVPLMVQGHFSLLVQVLVATFGIV